MIQNFLIVLKNLEQIHKNRIEKSNSKTAEITGDLIGNKIADKITSVSKEPAKEFLKHNETKQEEDAEITRCSERYISPKERKQITGELRLVPKNNEYF